MEAAKAVTRGVNIERCVSSYKRHKKGPSIEDPFNGAVLALLVQEDELSSK